MMDTKMIGSKIAAARKKAILSQAELAEKLFISPQAVGKWERGESLPDLITFNRLAQVLKVDLNYFSNDLETIPPAEVPVSAIVETKGWDMSKGNWVDADFSNLKNLKDQFSSSNLQRCKFLQADLSELLLKNNHIDHCDLSGADLSNSRIENSYLGGDKFNGSAMKGAAFSGSHLKNCDFSSADLTDAIFRGCAFDQTNLIAARFSNTTFVETHFNKVIFEGKFENCSFDNCAFSGVTFQDAVLVNTFFKGRSFKKIKLVSCTADKLTYEFLKNGKADLSGVTLLDE